MKTLIALLVFCATLTTYAQDLTLKFSNDTKIVASINGGLLLEKVNIEDLNNSEIFKEIFRAILPNESDPLNIDDFGIDYTQRMYGVAEFSADVNYTYVTYQIKDISSFEKTMKEKIGFNKFETKDGINSIEYYYHNKLFWNKDYAILMIADYVGEEFVDNYWEDNVYIEKAHELVEQNYINEDFEGMTDEELHAYIKKQQEQYEKAREEERIAEEKKKQEKAERRQKLEDYVESKMWQRVKSFYSDDLQNQGNNLKIHLNDEADVNFWYSNNSSILDYMLFGRAYGYRRYHNPLNEFMQLGSFFNGDITADLFLNETEIELKSTLDYHGNLNEHYGRILNQKINKKFAKYISNSDMGFLSSSFDTEEMLSAYPAIVENMILMYDTTFREEYQVFADIFSIIVDEEAIANAITGDVVYVLNGLSNKEVEYYTYKYDENYNYEKILSKKVELIPDFSFLIGSKETSLISKLVKLSIKHNLIEAFRGGYKFKDINHDIPFDLYFAYSNDIILTTTLKNKLDEFLNGGVQQNLNSEKTKMINKNSTAFFLDVNSLLTELLVKSELRGNEERIFTSLRNNLTEIRATMAFKGGESHLLGETNVPSSEKNGALYLLHLVDGLIKADKNQ